MTAHTEDEAVELLARSITETVMRKTAFWQTIPTPTAQRKAIDHAHVEALPMCAIALSAYHQFLSDRGYVIVPREPTQEMMDAYVNADLLAEDEPWNGPDARVAWEAMISAVGAP